MLKKFLTTIIVLAATATAWADGWSVTTEWSNGNEGSVDGQNTYTISVITWSESGDKATLADAITAANSEGSYMIRIIGDITNQDDALSSINKEKVDLSKVTGMTSFGVFAENTTVKYVILPDNTPKANVDALGKTVDAAASKNGATKTETYYVYTLNGQEPVEVADPNTVYNGMASIQQAVELTLGSYTYTVGEGVQTYDGNVLLDSNGKLYAGLDDALTVMVNMIENQYTYSNGTDRLIYPSTEPRTSDNQWGIIDYTPESMVTLSLNQQVAYTYKVGDLTYAYNGKAYNNNGLVFYDGGTEYEDVTESEEKYTYISDGAILEYPNANGVNYVLNDNTPWGNVGGTKINLTQGNDAYTYNGAIYTGYVSGENPYYGIADGDALPLSTISNPYTYTSDGKTYVYNGDVYTKNWSWDNTVYGGVFYILQERAVTNSSPLYTYKIGNQQYIYEGEIINEYGGFSVEINGENVYVSREYNTVKYYTKDDSQTPKYIYSGDNYYIKKDGVVDTNTPYGSESPYTLSQYNGELKYYTNADESQNVIYTGNIFKSQDGADTKEYGCLNPIELKYGPVYLKEDESLFTGKVYCTVDGETKTYYGFEGGEDVELSYAKYCNNGEILVTDATRLSTDGMTYCVGGDPVALTVAGYNADLYEVNDKNVVYEGKVYGEKTGYTVGTPVQLTYGNVYTYKNGDTDIVYNGVYLSEDKKTGYLGEPTPLTVTYLYTDPVTGETANLTSDKHLSSPYNMTFEVAVEEKEREVEVAGKYHIIAYVSKPGSLTYTLARWTELGDGNNHSGYGYNVTNVTALTLSGDVNYADIGTTGNTITEYGHVVYTDNGQSVTPERPEHDKSVQNSSPAMNGNALTYLDLTDAVFTVQTDMQFAKVSKNLVTVKLPTDENMNLIPDHAFDNLHYVSELCIPYNYTTIGSCAFYNTHALMHIYTTDNPEDASDDETIVDNGPYTYTFSANLKQIEGGIGVNSTFFGNHIEDVTDIYVLAEKAPLCGANAFAASMTYGNNGFAGNWTHPICRENYINSNKWICVLHYPSTSTDEEAAKYTDITRNYTLIDEVGNVDGDGKPIAWPRHAEFKRAYEQALKGYIWYDWKEYAEGATEVIQIYDASIVSANPTKYDQAYQGWHEFVLVGNSRSRDFDPQKENREYIQRDWYTICVPYDLTRSQLLNMLGVVNSEAEETVYALKENEGKWEVSETGTTVTQDLYPDVRALTHVSRDINENGTYVSGKVTLHLSEPLISVGENGNVTCSRVVIDENGRGYTHATLEGDDPIVMEGGHAYLIRPYVPKEWNDQIKNLGMYIMAMADSYNNAAVSAGLPAPYSYNEDCKFENKVYLPCFKHMIHAVKGNVSPNTSAKNTPEFVYEDAERQSPAYYRFVGTYTQTTVPQYAYYLGKNKTTGAHQFFRTTKETTKWNPYSAVIVGLSSNPNYTGVDTEGQTGIQSVRFVSDNENDLRALAGEVTNPSNAGKSLSFEQIMGDANGEATGIVDVNVNSNVNVSNNKVYSINGQYMGTSLNKLPKGIYIINGQKKVVK